MYSSVPWLSLCVYLVYSVYIQTNMQAILSWFCYLLKHQATRMLLSMSVLKENCQRLVFFLCTVVWSYVYWQNVNSHLLQTGDGFVETPALDTHFHQLSDTQPPETGFPGSLHTLVILIHVFVKFHWSVDEVFRKRVLGQQSRYFDIGNELFLLADHYFGFLFYLV